MKNIFVALAAIAIVLVFGSCSLVGGASANTPATSASTYPDSVVYKIRLSNETFLCSSFNVSNTDAEISLKLNEVYSISSDGKITWLGKDKVVSAVGIEKVPKQ